MDHSNRKVHYTECTCGMRWYNYAGEDLSRCPECGGTDIEDDYYTYDLDENIAFLDREDIENEESNLCPGGDSSDSSAHNDD